jgi:hypothetical protein
MSISTINTLPGLSVVGSRSGKPSIGVTFTDEKGKVWSGVWHADNGLLSEANSKLQKLPGKLARFRTIGLSMAPSLTSGLNLCAHSTAGCRNACNGWLAGMNCTPSTRIALIGRAYYFRAYNDDFRAQLEKEIRLFCQRSARGGRIPGFRGNVSTDIPWERLCPSVFDILSEFGGVAWDYTKWPVSKRSALPANYQLTHSFSEDMTFSEMAAVRAAGRSIAVAFSSAYAPSVGMAGALPERFIVRNPATGATIDWPCVNADRHDLRLDAIDGAGTCRAMHGKAGAAIVARAVSAGFMVDHPEGAQLRKRATFRGTVTIDRA